jgi:hypothetical protein
MTLKISQGSKRCVDSPFSIFCIASAGSERLDESPLPLNSPASLGNITFGRGESTVGAVFSAHAEVLQTGNKCL